MPTRAREVLRNHRTANKEMWVSIPVRQPAHRTWVLCSDSEILPEWPLGMLWATEDPKKNKIKHRPCF